LAGGADEEQTEHLRAFGHHLGIAFQCVDDVLGIWGDQATMGKSADSDLRARKLSLPVAAAMAGPSLQARQLRALYRQDRPLDDAQCHRARELLEASGAKETTLRLARRHARDAVGRLVKAGVPGSDLGALLDLAVHRDH
jgi:geranylgeranyl diphosphate synthase type I